MTLSCRVNLDHCAFGFDFGERGRLRKWGLVDCERRRNRQNGQGSLAHRHTDIQTHKPNRQMV